MDRDIENLVCWLYDTANQANVDGFVVGVSGGVDSAVVATLCSKTDLPTKLVALPCMQFGDDQSFEDVRLARLLADKLRLDLHEHDIRLVWNMTLGGLPSKGPDHDKIARGNLKSRLRMCILYYYANIYNLLVVGTTNYTEYIMGYFTKHGDGACDLEPIINLYKTEVYDLARRLEVPQEIIDRAPTAGFWQDQTDEGELGITYKELDSKLESGKHDENIATWIRNSEHKRKRPECP